MWMRVWHGGKVLPLNSKVKPRPGQVSGKCRVYKRLTATRATPIIPPPTRHPAITVGQKKRVLILKGKGVPSVPTIHEPDSRTQVTGRKGVWPTPSLPWSKGTPPRNRPARFPMSACGSPPHSPAVRQHLPVECPLGSVARSIRVVGGPDMGAAKPLSKSRRLAVQQNAFSPGLPSDKAESGGLSLYSFCILLAHRS